MKPMKRFSAKYMGTAAALLLLMVLSGCSSATKSQPESGASSTEMSRVESEIEAPSEAVTEESEASSAPENPISVLNQADAKAAFKQAMEAMRPELEISVAGIELGPQPENLMRNLYYELLGEMPQLKYTYDIAPVYDPENQIMRLSFSYMPYKTKTQPESADLVRIGTLKDLISAANNGLGSTSVGIYIANSELDVETMSLALWQCGGGYIVCELNRDATEITFSPTNDRTMDVCLDYLAQSDDLANTVISEQCSGNMSTEEQLAAVYSYLTENVRYDQRYYSNRKNMPYESQTAYGAFKDGLAICGGYALSLQLLCEKIGLDCHTVSGIASGENHMWNIIYVNGKWQYYDATYDRGRAKFGYRWFGVEESELAEMRTWNKSLISELTKG